MKLEAATADIISKIEVIQGVEYSDFNVIAVPPTGITYIAVYVFVSERVIVLALLVSPSSSQ